MGQKCDLCEKEEGIVFCFADQAVMCRTCDVRVHTANRLVAKHERVSLENYAVEDAPKCDICQDEKGVMFCTEDKAIMCRRCDLMIHTANQFTATHHRHLLSWRMLGLEALPAAGEDSGEGTSGQDQRGGSSNASSSQTAPRSTAKPLLKALGGLNPTPIGTSLAGNGGSPSCSHGADALNGASTSGRALAGNANVQGLQSGTNNLNTLSNMTQPYTGNASKHQHGTAAGAAPLSASSLDGATLLDFGTGGSGSGAGAQLTSLPSMPDLPGDIGMLSAAELLGVTNADGFNVKDVDALYMADDYGAFDDFDTDWSALLAVPDLSDFEPQHPALYMPSASQASMQPIATRSAAHLGKAKGAPRGALGASDGVVPDFFGGGDDALMAPQAKRQRN